MRRGTTQSFMPMSRSESMKTGVWKRSARSKALTANSKHSAGIGREEQDVLGVAVRGVGALQDVALLGARGHAGGGTDALDVDDDGGDLGVVGEAEQLVHERDAGPAVEVKARAPFQDAPITMPMAASSSSAWMMR